VVKRCLLLAVGLAIFGWMVWQTGPAQLWRNLLDWNWTLLACIAVWAVGYVLNAMSFRQVMRCVMSDEAFAATDLNRTLRLTIGGYALNYVTPFGLLGGEPWRIVRLRKVTDPTSANSAVVYYAMMHVCSHIIFWLVALAYAFVQMRPMLHSAVGDGVDWAVVAGIVLLIAVVVYIAGRIAVRKGWIGSLRRLLADHPCRFVAALMLEFASRIVNVAEYWLLLGVAFPDSTLATYGAAFLVVAFSSLFANALFFSPLQMGTREGGILLALQAFLPSLTLAGLLPAAVSISFATRIREFFWILVGMLLIIIEQRKKLSK